MLQLLVYNVLIFNIILQISAVLCYTNFLLPQITTLFLTKIFYCLTL